MLRCVYACIYVQLCKLQNAKNNVFLCPDAVATRQRTEAGVLNATNAISASNERKVYVCVYSVHCTLKCHNGGYDYNDECNRFSIPF